jgi:hypothetical protein
MTEQDFLGSAKIGLVHDFLGSAKVELVGDVCTRQQPVICSLCQ